MTLRDGIYKTLPLSGKWRSLLKSCGRAKERGETSQRKAARALLRDCGVEVSAAFIQEIRRRATRAESLLPGFTGLAADLTSRQLGGNNTPFENQVLHHAKRLEGEGVRGREILDLALHRSIEDRKQRNLRHIEQHCLSKIGLKAKPIIDAARDALARCDSHDIIRQVLSGEKLDMRLKRRPVDPDEDLTKVN